MKDGTKRPLPKEQRPWPTVREAADYVAVSPKSVYNAFQRGELRHVRVGGRAIRTTRAWVNGWLLAGEGR